MKNHTDSLYVIPGREASGNPEESTVRQFAFQAQLLLNVQDAITAADENFRITFWNGKAEEFFGWKADEVIGRDAREVMQVAVVGLSVDEAVSKLLKDGFFEGEVVCRHKNGGAVYTNVHSRALFGIGGEFRGNVASYRNIMQKKKSEAALLESEEKLRSILENSADAISMMDANPPRFTYLSPNIIKLTGFSPEELYLFPIEAILERVHSRDRHIVLSAYRQLLTEEVEFSDYEYRWMGKSGEYRWNRDRIKTVRDANGKPYAVVGTHRDVTEFKELTARLKLQQERTLAAEREKVEALNKAIEMKDEFLSLISHEFKTPITITSAAIQAMKKLCRNELSEKANLFLNKIQQSTYRQLKLVNNLLDITRINAGRFKVCHSNRDIVHLTNSITDSIRIYAEQKEIKLSFFSTVRERVIAIDEEKWERILLNLLSNAVKFTPRGKSIFVRLFQKNTGGKRKVCVQVRDEGIGIPEDKRGVIFERFGQVDSSLSRQAEGTGIGLSLTKQLVELMGGEILLESELGKGSKFTVTLPSGHVKEIRKEEGPISDSNARLITAATIEFSDV